MMMNAVFCYAHAALSLNPGRGNAPCKQKRDSFYSFNTDRRNRSIGVSQWNENAQNNKIEGGRKKTK